MNEIFLLFLSLSLSGSLVALLLFLLKPLCKDRLSKTWQYYILLVVILRLLIPFGPEVSLVSMIFNQAGSYAQAENPPAADSSKIDPASQAPPMDIRPKQEGGLNSQARPWNAGQAVIDLLWLGWLAPALILLLRKIIGYHRFVRSVKAGCTEIKSAHVLNAYREVCGAMNIKYHPGLFQNEQVAAPMLAGLIRPVIILPDTGLNDKELRYVLQHELTHYKRLDTLYKWLAQIAVCLHWYNPLAYRIYREINRNCELSCDEAVIRGLDKAEKHAYGDMLLKTIRLHQKTPPPAVSVTLNEDTKLIKERLNAIMKFRKTSKISLALSLILTVSVLCGATYIGAYAQGNGAFITPASIWDETLVHEIPDTVTFGQVPAANNLQFGTYKLDAAANYSLTLNWQDGSKTLTIALVGQDGYQKEYTLSNGQPETVNVPKSGLYYFKSLRGRETGDMQSLSCGFRALPASTTPSATPAPAPASAKAPENTQTVVYENVEMRHYEESRGSILAHPYIHDVRTNNTKKTIVGGQRGMLAYDKDGKPLKIDWFCLDTDLEKEFYFLFDWDSTEILPGETDDVFGGWSLNYYGKDESVNKIAFVLYCDKEITFQDGTIWKNPEFDKWLDTYEGKAADVNALENYYPYVQKVMP